MLSIILSRQLLIFSSGGKDRFYDPFVNAFFLRDFLLRYRVDLLSSTRFDSKRR